MSPRFASTPKPPYYAVIFSAQRTGGDNGYDAAAQAMAELAARQPGYLGAESTRDAAGFGITVSYWDSEENIRNWKRNLDHAAARQQGRAQWYSHYELRVAKVERAYNFAAPETD
ncbi:antibiotic biosynthesis monooxygenase [Ferrovibrio sp.]|uniref:antibiotic biosynthesis monooxygenase family protein n=1 Tax=Ferrovibrio sp. TaxID=1917215 RepID=UPI00311EDD15